MASLGSPSSSGQSARNLDEKAAEQGRTLCVGFNQTGASFACGTEAGIRVYNCDPFKESVSESHALGPITVA